MLMTVGGHSPAYLVVRNGGPLMGVIGDIARMVELAMPHQKDKTATHDRAAVSEAFRTSVKVVAGRGFEPLTFRL
jgi:hypothetical protein